MTLYNLGSVNIDHVYQLDHFVQPGETISSSHYQQLLGGKGANQSVALARAGAHVKHIGSIASHDQHYKKQLQDYGVDCEFLDTGDIPSGHAIIQVTPEGENAIVLYGGANQAINEQAIATALSNATRGDWLLMQNETNNLALALEHAKQRDMKIAFNPAPMTESVKQLPLGLVDLLIVNEVEAAMLTGETDVSSILEYFSQHWQKRDIILTLGKQGVRMLHKGNIISVDAFSVDAKDTTAAGDTFIGFFLAEYMQDVEPALALKRACAASAISVTQSGAAQSIPNQKDVDEFLRTRT